MNVQENQSNCILSRDNPLGALISLFYYSDINVCFQFIMLDGNYALYDCSPARAIPVLSQYRGNTEGTTLFQLLLVVG